MGITNRRLLIFSLDYPPNTGGISRLMAELAKGLIKSGMPVRVLTKRAPDDPDYYCIKDIEERVIYRRPFRELHALLKLIRVPRDALIICGTYGEGYIARFAGRRVVQIVHGGELGPGYPWWKIYRRNIFQRWMFRNSDLIIANSLYTAGLAAKIVPGGKIVAIPLGVDAELFKPGDKLKSRDKLGLPQDKIIVLTVARIKEHKGFDVVFGALSAMSASEKEKIIHVIAGIGPDKEKFQAKARELGIESQLKWLGFVADEDLPDLYRAADLFVLCTREFKGGKGVEGFGLVFLEAQASGTPVVGTRTGGIPDAVKEGEGGFFIAEDDSDGLKKLLEKLCREPASFEHQGRLARERVERECTWESYIARFLETLKHSDPEL